MNLPDRREAMVLRIPDRYWRGLVGRAVAVGDATGQAVVDRTNRVIGQSLATTKQGFRRWLARAHLGGKSRWPRVEWKGHPLLSALLVSHGPLRPSNPTVRDAL